MFDFTNICRACNSQKINLLDLFVTESESEPSLGEKFLICTSLDLGENDALPQKICYSCAKELETAYKFRIMSHKTDKNLRSLLQQSKCDDFDETLNTGNQIVIQQDSEYQDETVTEEFEIDYLEDNKDNEIYTIERLSSEDDHSQQHEIEYSYNVDEYVSESFGKDRPFVCENCNMKFYTQKALEIHSKVFHKNSKISRYQYTVLSGFNQIKNKNHTEVNKTLKVSEDISVINFKNTISTNTNFTSVKVSKENLKKLCSECGMPFENAEEYNIHIIKNHRLSCKVCGRLVKNEILLNKHMEMHNDDHERPFLCKVCGKNFMLQKHLDHHMIYHQDLSFVCIENNCNKRYSVKNKLVDHIRRLHNKRLTKSDVKLLKPENTKR